MIEINTVAPDWGHPLMTPEGKEIRVPKDAFECLRKLGVLERNRAILKPLIYELLDPQYDDLLMGLGRLLGRDLHGPLWCICRCRECQGREADLTDSGRSDERVNQIVRDVASQLRPSHRLPC